MSSPFDFDRRLTAWLDEQAPAHEPGDLADVALTRTRRIRQLPGWATLERWIPMETRYKFGAVPKAALILTVLAVLLALFSAIAIGQQPSPRLPAPLGVAANGLIAYDSNGDIWVTSAGGTGRLQLTSGPDVDWGPIFSPDGQHIAFWNKADTDGQASLVVMDPDGGHRQALVGGLTLNYGGDAGIREPTWAHDSKRLAYPDRVVRGLSSVNRISIVSLGGGDARELARIADGPTWSPDDARIAYRGGGLDGSGGSSPVGVYLVGSSGGVPQAVLTTPSEYNPAGYIYPQWSLDGTRLAFSSGNPDIYVTTVEHPSWHEIDHGLASVVLPVWSPDGSRVAYDRQITNGFHVVVADPDGSNQIELIHPEVRDRLPTWSPDGTSLLGYLLDGSGMMLLDPSGVAQPITLAAPGEVGYSSWQRLAP
jgi:Tol biopolymer transport system component